MAVVVKNSFHGVVSDSLLNQAVALAAAAPAMANLMSFFWADFGAGKDKPATIAVLLLLAAAGLVGLAIVPLSAIGLFLFIAVIFVSRIFWTGALTLRSAVWRANYPESRRANFMGRITVLSSLAMAGSSALCGWALDFSADYFRYFYPLAGLSLGLGALIFRAVRVRLHRQLRETEVRERGTGKRGFFAAFSLLNTDPAYRRYMIRMFLFGSGNLMLVGQTVLLLSEQLLLSRMQQMLIVTSIPLLVLPLTMPFWAGFFDRVGIVRFRAVQGWFFSLATITLFAGVLRNDIHLLWLSATLIGTGYSGGSVGWHLGHNAFATDGQATQYMAVHVSLTGLRGVLSPVIGVLFYQWLVSMDSAYGAFAVLLPLALSASGTLGFMRESRKNG